MCTAYHEAGHAVAACAMQRPIAEVSIIADLDSRGRCVHRPWPSSLPRGIEIEREESRRLEAEIITCLAGDVAQARLTGWGDSPGAESDMEAALAIAFVVAKGGRGEAEAYVKQLRARTEDLLRRPRVWAAVKALAAELLRHQRVGAKQAQRIITKAIRGKEGSRSLPITW